MSKGKKQNEKNKEMIIREKVFCPICGSTVIRPIKGRFRCLNCKALFSKPKRTKIKLRKKPRYIG